MNPEMKTPSADEVRREMSRRFDAANTKAANSRQATRDAAALRQSEADQPQPNIAPHTDNADDIGENDSLGG